MPVENNLYKRSDNRTFNNTNNTYKHITQYTTDVFNNNKTNKTHNVKKTYYNFIGDAINKHNTINTNDTYNVTKINKPVNLNDNNFNDNSYFTKKINHKSNITINITRHNHNNYEHNVIKKVHKHIKHINNYGAEIRKGLDKKSYYNFYNNNFNLRKIENTSLSQQTNNTNNITKTNTETINYVDNNYLNNDEIATVIVNPTPSLTENYLWIPETTDNVVPGLDGLLTYLQSKYAALTSLQNSITNMNNTINNEIQNIQTEINNIETTNPQNVSKNLSHHTSHTDFMYQRNTTNNDNRRQFVIQNHYFTYQRKGNHELQIQALNIIVADLQNQMIYHQVEVVAVVI